MAKEKWYERVIPSFEMLAHVVTGLGTHATLTRVLEEMHKAGFHNDEDVLSVMMQFRRAGKFVLMQPGAWWRVAE